MLIRMEGVRETEENHSTEEADQIARSKKKMKRSINAEEVQVEDIEDEVIEESHPYGSPRGVENPTQRVLDGGHIRTQKGTLVQGYTPTK